jgi:hypothetical protein
MHPTTMRVRVDFIEVADITYMPASILESIPTLQYRGIRFVHPHFQFIDQHRALSTLYENPPRETINNRFTKDIKRYDMLYEHYPLRLINVKNEQVTLGRRCRAPLATFRDTAIGGFAALAYWLRYDDRHLAR